MTEYLSKEHLMHQCETYRSVLADIRAKTGGKDGSMIGAIADAVLRENGPTLKRTARNITGETLARACAIFLSHYHNGGARKGDVQRLEQAIDRYIIAHEPKEYGEDASASEPAKQDQSP
jgi:hypothetical protein